MIGESVNNETKLTYQPNHVSPIPVVNKRIPVRNESPYWSLQLAIHRKRGVSESPPDRTRTVVPPLSLCTSE